MLTQAVIWMKNRRK